MDPNETLREIRRLTIKRSNDPSAFDSFDAAELCELFDALDAWLVRGGFTPDAWSDAGRPLGARYNTTERQ